MRKYKKDTDAEGLEVIGSYKLLGPGDSFNSVIRKPKKNRRVSKTFKKSSTATLSKDIVTTIALKPGETRFWEEYELPGELIHNLVTLGYKEPTEVQRRVLQSECGPRVIIAAETGSGKTLAYALKVIPRMAKSVAFEVLVIAPTRELSLQTKEVFKDVTAGLGIHTLPLVGGISIQKQHRLLKKGPEVVVATPGRLLAVLEDPELNVRSILRKNLKFLVLDEADRLFEQGDGKTVEAIIGHCGRPVQTFALSATLLFNRDRIDQLFKKLKVGKERETVIDLGGGEMRIASGISEHRILCGSPEKDYHLVYVLLSLPPRQRAIVFVNSIEQARRLQTLLSLLRFETFVIHSKQRQKHRLGMLEKFCDQTKKCVMVATDVAARGIDIQDIHTVVHYNVPRSSNLYVHRSGRTGRMSNTGSTVVLVCPEEMMLYRDLMSRLDKRDIPELNVNFKKLKRLKRFVDLSEEIEKRQFALNTNSKNINWFKKQAEECGIELDEHLERKESYCMEKCDQHKIELAKLITEQRMLFDGLK